MTTLDDGKWVTWRVPAVNGKIDLRKIVATIAEAKAHGVTSELIGRTERALERCLELHRACRESHVSAKHRLAEEAAQTLFELADRLNGLSSIRSEIERDRARQAGTKKSRNPDLQDWIVEQIKRTPDATTKELYAFAPLWVQDAVGIDRFSKRIASARKVVASK